MAPLIFFPMLLFSGFYVNSDSVRSWVKWLEYISPIRYSLEALVYNEFQGTKYIPNPINFLNFEWGYWSCMLYLAIIGGGIRLLGFFALLVNARSS